MADTGENFYVDPHSVWAGFSLESFEDVDLELSGGACLRCGESLTPSWLYRQLRVCPHCRFHYSISPARRAAALADAGTFRETDVWIEPQPDLDLPGGEDYAQILEENVKRTGLKEAALTGICEIGGTRVALTVLDFGFLGGGVGVVAGEKITRMLNKAAQGKTPCLAVLSSSGRRKQEGLFSLIQTAKVMLAMQRLKERKLPFISIVCNPVFGQVLTSLVMQSDIILAEPGARMGLTSPKPSHKQDVSAEAFLESGQVDRISDREYLRYEVETILDVLKPRESKGRKDQASSPSESEYTPRISKNYLDIARHPERPSAQYYVEKIFYNFLELHGDRIGGDDLSITTGLGVLGGVPVAVITQRDSDFPIQSSGFRKAQRIVKLASDRKMPVVSFVDTCGFVGTSNWETKGVASAVSDIVATMLTAETPVVSVILREGGDDYEFPFTLSDRTLLFQNAFFTHTKPVHDEESAQSEPSLAASAFGRLSSVQAKQAGFADVIVPEPEGGAHVSPEESANLLRETLLETVLELSADKSNSYLKARHSRYDKDFVKSAGNLRGTIRNEFNAWRAGVRTGTRILRGGEGNEGVTHLADE